MYVSVNCNNNYYILMIFQGFFLYYDISLMLSNYVMIRFINTYKIMLIQVKIMFLYNRNLTNWLNYYHAHT